MTDDLIKELRSYPAHYVAARLWEMSEKIESLSDEIERLRAREARLREALEPFARAADALDLERWDDESIDGSSAIVTGLHCRNARAALGEEEKGCPTSTIK